MANILTRTGKGSALIHSEMDENLNIMSSITELQAGATHTITGTDQHKLIEYSSAGAIITLTQISTILAAIDTTSFKVTLKNISSDTITINVTGDTFDNGATSISLISSDSVVLQTDSTGAIWNTLKTNNAGRHTVYISASEMLNGSSSSGAAEITDSIASPIISVRSYSNIGTKYSEFAISLPKKWDLTTLSFQIHYFNLQAGNGDVKFLFSGVAIGDADNFADNFSAEIPVVETVPTTAGDISITVETNITVAGTPKAGDVLFMRIGRSAGDAQDTETGIINVLGVTMFYNSNTNDDT